MKPDKFITIIKKNSFQRQVQRFISYVLSVEIPVFCLCAAGAGERHEPPEEAAGGAGGHEAALPGNRGEGGGPAGQTGAGRHQERTQQVRKVKRRSYCRL